MDQPVWGWVDQTAVIKNDAGMEAIRLIDRGGQTPAYQQVSQLVMKDIESRGVRPGTRLPSERVLCERIGVSRVTLRRGLKALADQGLLETTAGRGWYVPARRISEPPGGLMSFTALATAAGFTASSRLLRKLVRPATLDEAELLAIPPGSRVLELERLRFVDGLAVAIALSRVPLVRAEGIQDVSFEDGSLYQVLEEKVGVRAIAAEYAVEAIAADERTASLLDMSAGDPVLLAVQTTYGQGEEPIELCRMHYRGDRYRFRARLQTELNLTA
jgi:GntR family transcriptional regulator